VVYVQVQSGRDARHQARADASFAARAAAKELGDQTALLRATVGQLTANPSVAQAAAHPEGCTLTFGVPGQGHLDILRPDGAAVCSSRARGRDGRLAGYAGESWVRSALRSATFLAPLVDKATGEPVALFAAPVAGKAVVAGFVNLSKLGPQLESIYGGNRHAEFLVVSPGSHVIARSLEPRRWIGRSLEGTRFARSPGEERRVDVDGTRRIYASSAVPGTQWRLFVGEDEARALAAGKRLRNRELVLVLASLALVLFATLFVYRRVVVPIKRLSDGVRSSAREGRFEPVTVSGPAEVQGLADQVNAFTASVNAQETVRLAKEEAQRANEAKSRFLTHMSHEMRTPLAAIMGFAELLQRRELAEKERDWTEHIAHSGQYLLGMVNELLEISRIEAGKVTVAAEPVDVRSAVEEVLQLVAPLAVERSIRLETAADGPHGVVLADPVRLKQVLLNLISNAIKYNRESGTVTVAVGETSPGRVRIAVTDTGEGLTRDELERLFTPFERLGAEQGSVGGSGLGLVVARGLVEAMHGRLDVESTPGTGTTFAFELPSEEAAAARRPPAAAPTANAATVGRVLYIEDNRANLQIVDSILTDLRPGIELHTATDGRAGAELAEQRRPDLLLLDLNLPDMQGEEVLRRLRARTETADVPILILSADSTSRNITRLLKTGADAYLTKPLDVPQFLDTVDRLLAAR
jgi:signal transduction histidine kinase/ActR/RegA family two-component response regulator